MFQECKLRMTLSIPYGDLRDLRNAVKQKLNNMLFKVMGSVNMVFVCYSNLKFKQKMSKIFRMYPFVHFDVTVKALMMKPQIGMTITGQVMHVDPQKLSVLWGGYLQNQVHFDDTEGADYVIEDGTRTWQYEGKKISEGSTVTVTIQSIDVMWKKFMETRAKLVRVDKEAPKKELPVFHEAKDTTINNMEFDFAEPAQPEGKTAAIDADVSDDEITITDLHSDDDSSSPKKKKKKKEKKKKEKKKKKDKKRTISASNIDQSEDVVTNKKRKVAR